jgi:hypothetical protein
MSDDDYNQKLVLYHEVWGYVFWIPVVLVLFLIPEVTAAVGAAIWHLPTFSTTVGHLEYVWKVTGLFVVAVMVFTTVNAVRRHRQDRKREGKTPGGRYSLDSGGGGRIVSQRVGDSREVAVSPLVYLPVSAAVILLGGYLANHFGDHWTLAYVVWSLIAFFTIILPSVFAYRGHLVSFPTLFRTVANLEHRFHMLATVVIAFLVALSIHLTLYPWPNVAHVLQTDPITPTVSYDQASSRIIVTGTTENCTRPDEVTVVVTPTPQGVKQSQTVDVVSGTFKADFPGKQSDVKEITAYCGAPKVGSSP